jgi:abortive infection bacteriophage resistance protein
VKYDKGALTFEEQAARLLDRGLVAERSLLIARLQSVSYYRLSGYWYPFRRPDDDTLLPGTTLEKVWEVYTFDRLLRLLVLDAIERVEVSVRTDLVYHLAHLQGPFGYTNHDNLPNLSAVRHADLTEQMGVEYRRSGEQFTRHFREKYGSDHELPPYWMIAELMTFGMIFTLFRGAPTSVKQEISLRYGVADRVLESWLQALNSVRNICAHHGRLWNRELGNRPMIPRKDRRWHEPVTVSANRVFGVLTILKYLLSYIAPHTRWPGRLYALLADHAEIPLGPMGFPANWRQCPVWQEAS